MSKYAIILTVVLFFSSSCSVITSTPQLQQKVLGPICPERKLVANAWSLDLLPYTIREEAVELMMIAKNRDTRGGTDPAGYKGDAFSRTLGSSLREKVKDRAVIEANLSVYYLDPQTTYVTRFLGVLRITNGIGSMSLLDNPLGSIVEIIWPDGSFISPVLSGGERRLWLFPSEWKDHCVMNVHGLVP